MACLPTWACERDGAGQFRLLAHGLCWVHAERLINKLIPFTEGQRLAIETVQDQIWSLYQDLKAYKTLTPQGQQQQRAALEASFEQIFTTTTSFETLNQVLRRLNRRKAQLLKVLDRPDLPLHNNVSEQDIREFVRKRKISGSTRSDNGRRCRDTFAAPQKDLSQARGFLLGVPHGSSQWSKLDSQLRKTHCPESQG